MIERYLLVILAVILTGTVGAFFLYVPILPTIAVFAILSGLVTVFLLGFYAGHAVRTEDPDVAKKAAWQ